jgi:predicted nuclease of predicted toxin-antitoxin system
VKLLFDENLSPRLCDALAGLFPGAVHVRRIGLQAAGDSEVWSYALAHGFAVVTKDADFRQRSFLYGQPPKVIWVRLGNCSTRAIEALLRQHSEEIRAFLADEQMAFLALS